MIARFLVLGVVWLGIRTPAVLQFKPKCTGLSAPCRGGEMVSLVFALPLTTSQEKRGLGLALLFLLTLFLLTLFLLTLFLLTPLLLTPLLLTLLRLTATLVTVWVWDLVPLQFKPKDTFPAPCRREALVSVVFPVPLITSQEKRELALPFAIVMRSPPLKLVIITKSRATNGDAPFTSFAIFCIVYSFL
jgi:hypothetical protein